MKFLNLILLSILILNCNERSGTSVPGKDPNLAINDYHGCLNDGNLADWCSEQTDVRVRVDNTGNRFFEYMGMYYMLHGSQGSTIVIRQYNNPVWGSSSYYEDDVIRRSAPRALSTNEQQNNNSRASTSRPQTQQQTTRPSQQNSTAGTSRSTTQTPRSQSPSSSASRSSSSSSSSSSSRSSSSSSSSRGNR